MARLTFLIIGLFLSVGAKAGLKKEMNTAFEQLHQHGFFNGAVLISKNGQTLINKSYGFANAKSKQLLGTDSVFRLASVSKTFTATALQILMEQNSLSVDSKVSKFIKDFPYDSISLGHLMNHSSGLPEYIFGMDGYEDKDSSKLTNLDVLSWLVEGNKALEFEPGQGWNYSNTGYAMIPLIIESVAKVSYPEFLRTHIFNKLGMAATYHISELGKINSNRIAMGHAFNYKRGGDDLAFEHPVVGQEFSGANIFGAGDIFSTTEDMLKWDRAMYTDKLISTDLKEEAFKSFMLPEGFPAGWGLGWQVADSKITGRIIHHHGLGDGFRSRFYRFIDKEMTIILLGNARENYIDDVLLLAQQFLFKGKAELPKPSLAEKLAMVQAKHGIVKSEELLKDLEPNNWKVNERDLNNLAMTYWFAGEHETGIALLESMITVVAESPNLWLTLANAYEQVNQNAKAKSTYQKVIELTKANPRASRLLKEAQSKVKML